MNIYLKLIEILEETIPSIESRLDALEAGILPPAGEDAGLTVVTVVPVSEEDHTDESEVSRDIGGGSEEDVATGIIGRGLRNLRAVVDGSDSE